MHPPPALTFVYAEAFFTKTGGICLQGTFSHVWCSLVDAPTDTLVTSAHKASIGAWVRKGAIETRAFVFAHAINAPVGVVLAVAGLLVVLGLL